MSNHAIVPGKWAVEIVQHDCEQLDPRRTRTHIGLVLFDNEFEANRYAESQHEMGDRYSTYAYVRRARADDKEWA